MKKVVIFDTALGSSNVGDEIILDAVSRNMADVFDRHFSLRLATHVNNFSMKQVLHRNTKIRYFQDADWKFICGTNLIAQTRLGKINSQWQIYPSNLSIYNNCILIGAGTTERTEKLDFYARYLYGKVLSKQYVHSVRDELTKKIVESLGCRAINTGCPTLWELTPEHCASIPQGKADNCVISVSGYKDQIDEKRDRMMLHIIRRNYDKVWAWIQTTEDESYLSRLEQSIGMEPIPRIYSLSRFRDVLRNSNVDYIGTRLHGGVFALQNYCRSIVISIDHRADGFFETNNLPILRRKNVEGELEDRINSSFATEIRIHSDAIAEFKSQFSGSDQ